MAIPVEVTVEEEDKPFQTIPIHDLGMSLFCELVTLLQVPMVVLDLKYIVGPVKPSDITRISVRVPCRFSKPRYLQAMKSMMEVTSSTLISSMLGRSPVLLTVTPLVLEL